jgi:hypothetical protein
VRGEHERVADLALVRALVDAHAMVPAPLLAPRLGVADGEVQLVLDLPRDRARNAGSNWLSVA